MKGLNVYVCQVTDLQQSWPNLVSRRFISHARKRSHRALGLRPFWGRNRGPTFHLPHALSVCICSKTGREKKSVGASKENHSSQTEARLVDWWPGAITKLGKRERENGVRIKSKSKMDLIRVPMEDTGNMVSVTCEISYELSAKRLWSSPEAGWHPARVESSVGRDCGESYNNRGHAGNLCQSFIGSLGHWVESKYPGSRMVQGWWNATKMTLHLLSHASPTSPTPLSPPQLSLTIQGPSEAC